MSLLVYILVVLIVVGIVSAVAYYIPFPPPMAFLRWLIPVIALLVALLLIVQHLGLAGV